jgi:hypothetical protein
MTWTTYQDIQDRWFGDPLPATQPQIETLIADAEDTILREFPTIQARIDDDSLPLIRVVKVTYNMVARVLRNPTGMRSLTRGAGPYQESQTYGGDEPGALYLTEQDKRELQESTQGQEAYSIDMTQIGFVASRPYQDSDYANEQGVWVSI